MVLPTAALTITALSPLAPEAREILAVCRSEMEPICGTGGCCGADDGDLSQPNVQFLVARLDGSIVGCIALVDRLSYGEVKSFFVSQNARLHGVGGALMEALLEASRDLGIDTLRIASGDKLQSAMALWTRHGFSEREGAPDAGAVLERSRFALAQQSSRARTIA